MKKMQWMQSNNHKNNNKNTTYRKKKEKRITLQGNQIRTNTQSVRSVANPRLGNQCKPRRFN